MNYPAVEEYLFILYLNEKGMTVDDLLENTKSAEIPEADLKAHTLYVIDFLQDKSYITVEIKSHEAVVRLTRKGKELAAFAAEMLSRNVLNDWNGVAVKTA